MTLPKFARVRRVLRRESGFTLLEVTITAALLSVVIVAMLAIAVTRSTPLLLGALAGIYSERSGVVNIAIEGMMLSAAFFGFIAGVYTGSLPIALAVALLTGAVMALLHAVLSITFKVDQIISGTVINILAVGMTGYLFTQWYGSSAPFVQGSMPRIHIPLLADIPGGGRLFEQQPGARSGERRVGEKGRSRWVPCP